MRAGIARAAVPAICAALTSASVVSGCARHRSADAAVGAPVLAVAQTAAPGTEPGSGVCIARGADPGVYPAVHGLVSVDPFPTGVVLIWLPGLNGRPCRAVLARGGTLVARQLAVAVEAAPAAKLGTNAGVAGDATAVGLSFTFAGRTAAEEVTVGLGGQELVGAPGRAPRELTDALAAVLRPLAPPAWRPRLNRG